MNEVKVTAQMARQIPLVPRLLLMIGLSVLLLEALLEAKREGLLGRLPLGTAATRLSAPAIARYLPLRTWVLAHPLASAATAAALAALTLLVARAGLLFWHNQVVARLAGTHLVAESLGFPERKVDLLEGVRRRPAGHLFVGLAPRRRWFGWGWRPVYISPRQRSMHRQVIGKTGSGKTLSVLWPQVLQDALDGLGQVVMSAKGSDEEVALMQGIARLAGRESQLRVFSLPAWNRPQLFSHAYNMVHVRPRTPTDLGGDPVAMAERVLSVLGLGDDAYYSVQAQILFTNVCRLLHGMVDERGHGIPFVMRDIAVVLKGLGDTGPWGQAVDHCLQRSRDVEAAQEIRSQVSRLGREVEKTFTGLIGAVDKFLGPLVNAYAPDIIFEEVLDKNLLVYVQLPANLYKIQAPALGRVMLMDIQQEGSLRQVFRKTRNQRPFSVTVDEFYNFADVSIIDSLNKLRDANVWFTLAHQSPADLELVSKEFAVSVWDATRCKDVLNQNNHELCERLAKSIGTCQEVERTVRQRQGALWTALRTGEASSKLVETFRLHPNRIKALARCGQGFVLSDEGVSPVAYGMLPDLGAELRLFRNAQDGARALRLHERLVGAGLDGRGARSS